MPPRVRHGIQFVQLDPINSELRVIGDDEAGMFLWAAQWLDEHRGFVVTAASFAFSDDPDDETDLTATLVIGLNHAGEPSGGRGSGRLGPWPHGVPPMSL
jgi:hypothetical protein